ncbi:TEF [Lepeophtheirus salmonis]|uniref:TEF n=1 Tax=Lepeophtheirus salmonis TaxID=72036 RepID=A0A7R8CU69_LEPSM|nr:TEF [Lepeophtheirus salmonis]CAF2881832.1 TEF [Lepeophtheirus salmonis]
MHFLKKNKERGQKRRRREEFESPGDMKKKHISVCECVHMGLKNKRRPFNVACCKNALGEYLQKKRREKIAVAHRSSCCSFVVLKSYCKNTREFFYISAMEMGELHQHHHPQGQQHRGSNNNNSVTGSGVHHSLHHHAYTSSSPSPNGGSGDNSNHNNSSIGQILSMLNDISPDDPIENLLVVSSQDSTNAQVGSLSLGATTVLPPPHPSNSTQDNHSHHPSNFIEPSPAATYQPEYNVGSNYTSSRRKTYYSDDGGDEYFNSPHTHHHIHHLQENKHEASEYDDPNSSSVASSTTSVNLGPRDEKYWERRRKNNMAAKKSRDARRVRENQLRLKVLCLENANQVLRTQLKREKDEHDKTLQALNKEKEDNKIMRHKMSRFSNEIHHQHHHPTSHLPNS